MRKLEKQNPADTRSQRHKTILVVEDDRTHRSLMEKILQECAFSTVPAENGLVALARLDTGQKFDLIIMDWDMPELNGLETTKAIRARHARGELPYIPILAFTGNKLPGDREKCLAAGMDAYLPKDVWLPKWRDTLAQNLEGLIEGNMDLSGFSDYPAPANAEMAVAEFDLNAFDVGALAETAKLLKNEFPVAVEEYLEDAAGYIRAIKEGLEAGDAEKVARGSHPLKSNSKGFGLSAVSAIAEAINTVSRKGVIKPVESLLPQLRGAFERAEKRLREAVASR